ncbi:hypothetical protein [Ignatzschineria cameli]|uniref:Uncharacterized protein n=1 Tax=Ignatzschineria cameli TaxID=2182793 RepID=A0A2U2AQA7_9GAMM|nr:hypothetical protein [Ignatzschineria cameli]PWD85799.1 hypothetical protein DC077_07125 [Ignatzschineria cameli]PWD89427.1 hypothetical protein DC079_06750 [Ignatzschineria cameli]PWD90899.1 hypothetical protein DC081_06460 [Ignatzschineria cameli]PWD91687.1 hypothetical protein DC078_06745 [Ignatzschineria cameli]
MWLNYLRKRGTINVSRKIEQVVGLFTALWVSANSKEKVPLSNYMPYEMSNERESQARPKSQAEKIKNFFNKIGTANE